MTRKGPESGHRYYMALTKKPDLRFSHENPAVQDIYQEFLGEPGSEVAHRLLHTEQSTLGNRYGWNAQKEGFPGC